MLEDSTDEKRIWKPRDVPQEQKGNNAESCATNHTERQRTDEGAAAHRYLDKPIMNLDSSGTTTGKSLQTFSKCTTVFLLEVREGSDDANIIQYCKCMQNAMANINLRC